jgi:hypothetical protein
MVSDSKITDAVLERGTCLISRAGGLSLLLSLSCSGGGFLQSAHWTLECEFRNGHISMVRKVDYLEDYYEQGDERNSRHGDLSPCFHCFGTPAP